MLQGMLTHNKITRVDHRSITPTNETLATKVEIAFLKRGTGRCAARARNPLSMEKIIVFPQSSPLLPIAASN